MTRCQGRLLLVVGVLFTWMSGAIPVGAQSPGAPAVEFLLPPDATVEGTGLDGWSARWWQWSLSIPNSVSPYADETGERCGIGQSGHVFFLSQADHDVKRSCAVPLGVNIFVAIIGSECSTVEAPPFFGRDEAELLACATGNVDMAERVFDMSVMRFTLDGQSLDDLAGYRTATPVFTIWLPPDNSLGATESTALAAADGYQLMLESLPEGVHELSFTAPGPHGGKPVTVSYTLTVTSGAFGAAPASPAAASTIEEHQIEVADGRTLRLRCAGVGSPTIVFDAGGPNDLGASAMIGQPGLPADLAGMSRFCAYDRGWQGASDPATEGRTFRDSAADLHELLARSELGCPCVLVGESMGGAIALILATMHPEDLAGLVLIDPPPPGMIDRVLALAPPDSPEAGLANGFPADPEHFDFLASLRQIETPSLPAPIPVVVLVHGEGAPPPCFPCSPEFPVDEFETWWQQAQVNLARALNGTLVVVDDSDHFISENRPDAIVQATQDVVDAVRDRSI